MAKRAKLQMPSDDTPVLSQPGQDALWAYFGLSYANFSVLPRVLLHAMPDEWQGRFAALLQELDQAFPRVPAFDYEIVTSRDGSPCHLPSALTDYRHPRPGDLDEYRQPTDEETDRLLRSSFAPSVTCTMCNGMKRVPMHGHHEGANSNSAGVPCPACRGTGRTRES